MKERSFDEMIAYFNRRVSEMDIARDYKIELLGMIAALGYKHEKTAQQWIPCSERLPDKTDDYLCSYNGCAVADICEYDPDRNEWGFFYDGGWKVVSNVIAWLPLPEPYTERRKE